MTAHSIYHWRWTARLGFGYLLFNGLIFLVIAQLINDSPAYRAAVHPDQYSDPLPMMEQLGVVSVVWVICFVVMLGWAWLLQVHWLWAFSPERPAIIWQMLNQIIATSVFLLFLTMGFFLMLFNAVETVERAVLVYDIIRVMTGLSVLLNYITFGFFVWRIPAVPFLTWQIQWGSVLWLGFGLVMLLTHIPDRELSVLNMIGLMAPWLWIALLCALVLIRANPLEADDLTKLTP